MGKYVAPNPSRYPPGQAKPITFYYYKVQVLDGVVHQSVPDRAPYQVDWQGLGQSPAAQAAEHSQVYTFQPTYEDLKRRVDVLKLPLVT
jgi:hypothetical protein